MTVEIPIEILNIPNQLRTLFTEKLPEAASGSAEEKEKNFLSRALAAYALHKLGECSIEDAVSSVVDGGGDGGIDAIFHAQTTQTLWIIQSKFISTGRGEPDLSSVGKFKEGLENLLRGNFAAFNSNAAWTRLLPRIEFAFREIVHVEAVLVYSGIGLVSDDRLRMFENLRYTFCQESDNYLNFTTCNLTTIHSWLIGTDQGIGIPQVKLTLLNPGWVKQPYETIFGLLSLADLSNLYATYSDQIIAANIRLYQGGTDVNNRIIATIENEPQHFFYLNNGITAYCERFELTNLDRGKQASKRITAYGFSIVNGAQTLVSVAKFFGTSENSNAEGYVFIKIIFLKGCPNNREFANQITYSTNFQNKIGLQDFIALDEQQEIIANQLQLSGISYHYKTGVRTPSDQNNFTLEEATTALASLIQSRDCCDFVTRILANRKSLWSKEEIYSGRDLLRSYYSRVFNPSYSARTVWRSVQVQRLVIEQMKNSGKASTGIRKTFFINARWLILNVLFLKKHPERGNDLALTSDEINNISRYTGDLAEKLWEVCIEEHYISRQPTDGGTEEFVSLRHFKSVFSNASDCQILRNKLLAKLNNANTGSI